MALWLNEADVRAVLDPAELIDAMESALAAFSAGEMVQPLRTAIEMGGRSFFFVMPALCGAQGVMGAKLVSVVPENAGRGLHTHVAAIALCDAQTGELLGVMDGRYITEIRTAAVSAVSVKHLARPEARVLAILGSGVQAASHLRLLRLVRCFDEVRVWSPTPENLERFVKQNPEAEAVRSAAEAVRGADVVLVATSSATPVICADWVADGAHVVAIGASRPWQQELDPALVARARLVVDSRAAALVEAGDIVKPIEEGRFGEGHVAAELGEVIAGKKPGRRRANDVTVFKSLGLAVEDVTAAGLAYRRAVGKNLGLTLT